MTVQTASSPTATKVRFTLPKVDMGDVSQPGTLAFTLDTLELQREARHRPIHGAVAEGLPWFLAGVLLFGGGSVLTGGLGALYGGFGGGNRFRPAPRSVRKHGYFALGLAESREESAMWVAKQKEAGVLTRGRDRRVNDLSKLPAAFELIEDEGVALTQRQRDGITAYLCDVKAESLRLDSLDGMGGKLRTKRWGERARIAVCWPLQRFEYFQTRLDGAREGRAKTANEWNQWRRAQRAVPQGPAWVPGTAIDAVLLGTAVGTAHPAATPAAVTPWPTVDVPELPVAAPVQAVSTPASETPAVAPPPPLKSALRKPTLKVTSREVLYPSATV